MANYFDIDDIIAEETQTSVTLRTAILGLGRLEPGNPRPDLADGTKMNMPLWLSKVPLPEDAELLLDFVVFVLLTMLRRCSIERATAPWMFLRSMGDSGFRWLVLGPQRLLLDRVRIGMKWASR